MAVDRDDINLTPRKGYERYIMTGDSIVNVDSNISPLYLNVGFFDFLSSEDHSLSCGIS